jgi:hypothetical protein
MPRSFTSSQDTICLQLQQHGRVTTLEGNNFSLLKARECVEFVLPSRHTFCITNTN